MQHTDAGVARSEVCVCVSVCVLGTWVSCTKMAQPTEMAFGVLTHMGSRNHVPDKGPD